MRLKNPYESFKRISKFLKTPEEQAKELNENLSSIELLKSGKAFSAPVYESKPEIIEQGISRVLFTEQDNDAINLLKSGKAFSGGVPEPIDSPPIKKISSSDRLSKIIKFYSKIKEIIRSLVFKNLYSIRKEINDKFMDIETKVSMIDMNRGYGVGGIGPSTSNSGSGGGSSNVQKLDDLSDVTITSPTPGQALIWNGVEWVNADTASLDPSANNIPIASSATVAVDTITIVDSNYVKWMLIIKDAITGYTLIEALDINAFCDGTLTSFNVIYTAVKKLNHLFSITTNGTDFFLNITNNEAFTIYVSIKRYKTL